MFNFSGKFYTGLSGAVFILILTACTPKPQASSPYLNLAPFATVNSKGANITLTFRKAAFKSKAISGSVSRIKSLGAYLTTNFNDPFVGGSNPLGDNVIRFTNFTSSTTSLVFSNIPPGGPYYAVIAAYDNLVESPVRNNITRKDLTILSSQKNWSRSLNSVTVNNSSLTFSDTSIQLKVKLQLEPINSFGTDINVTDGQSLAAGLVVVEN